MLTPSTSICSAARAAVALIPGFLRRLPAEGLRMANSSEELLDFFEEQYGDPPECTTGKTCDVSRCLEEPSRTCH
jgi:hypothetical protein